MYSYIAIIKKMIHQFRPVETTSNWIGSFCDMLNCKELAHYCYLQEYTSLPALPFQLR